MKLYVDAHGEKKPFELDTALVECRSIFKDAIALPYHGQLPDFGHEVENAYITFNIKLHHKSFVNLVVIFEDGTRKTFLLDATNDEIIEVLNRFFFEDKLIRSKGLSPYWLGVKTGYYLTWMNVTDCPLMILDSMRTVPKDKVKTLIKFLESL